MQVAEVPSRRRMLAEARLAPRASSAAPGRAKPRGLRVLGSRAGGWKKARLRGLTFELSGCQRQDARARTVKMPHGPQAGPWWPAVGAPLERGVRHQCAQLASEVALARGHSASCSAPRQEQLRYSASAAHATFQLGALRLAGPSTALSFRDSSGRYCDGTTRIESPFISVKLSGRRHTRPTRKNRIVFQLPLGFM